MVQKNGRYFMLHSLYNLLVYKKAHTKCQVYIFYQKLKDCALMIVIQSFKYILICISWLQL